MSKLASRRKDLVWGNDRLKGKGNPNFSGGKYIDEKGYVRVLRTDHPFNNKGYVYEHRLVMEAFIGRFLESGETVHHINEIKLDNRLENLFLTTVAEHSLIHRKGKREGLESATKRRNTLRAKRKASGNRKRGAGGKFS